MWNWILPVAKTALGLSKGAGEERTAKANELYRQKDQHLQEQRDFWDAFQQAEATRMATGADALKKLQQTTYLMHRDKDYVPPTVMSHGKQLQLPDFGFGPRKTSETEWAGANALRQESMRRLADGMNGNLPTPTQPGPFKFDYKGPSWWERLLGLGGLGAETAGAIWGPQGK